MAASITAPIMSLQKETAKAQEQEEKEEEEKEEEEKEQEEKKESVGDLKTK
jgi:ribosomal protein L12E/L44/L45/RPP1/RPP2